jgi:hypothetical protein
VDEPASEPVLSPDAGNNSSDQESSAAPNNDADGNGGDDGPKTSSPPDAPVLPDGWEILYAAALRRAQSKSSLPKFAKQFWDQNGSWEAHKNGPNAATATAIYDLFNTNFGRREVIDEQLRELI